MKIKNINLEDEVLIIAEIGNNHEGNIDLAKKMIQLASESGVQAVKFQTIIPENLVTSDQTERIAQLKKFQFSIDQFRELKNVCDNEGVLFLTTPFDVETVNLLDELVPAFKISSGDNTFYPLLEKVAITGKPIILSTGLTTKRGVEDSIRVIENTWKVNNITSGDLALLHCNVSYPTPNEDVNLKVIEVLKEFNYTVGYSDHSLGIDASLFSIFYGARIIEKHFTLDKTRTTFRDHQLSADPSDMKNLVAKIKLFNLMSGNDVKCITTSELSNIEGVRRSISTSKVLKKGDILKKEDLTWLRPGNGLAPGKEEQVISKMLTKDYPSGKIIRIEDLI